MRNNLLGLAVIVCLTSLGCSKSGRRPVAEPYSGPPLTLAVVNRGEDDRFWTAVRAGAEQAAKELGNIELKWMPPSVKYDVDSQIEAFTSTIEKKVDGVILAPMNSDPLATVTRNAVNHDGLTVVAIDSGLDGAKAAVRVSTDHFQSGKLAAEKMAESINEQGNVIVLRFKIGDENMEQRANGVLDELQRYKKIKVVSSDQRGGADSSEAKIKVAELLLIFGEDLAGIVAVEQSNAVGVLNALRDAELDLEKVKLVAFGPNDELFEALDNGSCSGIVLQDPFEMGYFSVLSLVSSITGKKVDPFVSSGSHLMTTDNQDKLISRMPDYLGK